MAAGTVLLIPHMDAGNRSAWEGDQDKRPLSDLGRRQATALAAVLSPLPIVALYASPALRARQTLEPLALNLRLEIVTEPGLAEKQLGEDREALEERGWAALQRIARPDAPVAAASHGDLILATARRAAREFGGSVGALEHRGQWYEIEFGERRHIELVRGPGGFPR